MLLLILHGVLLVYSIIGRLAIAIAENFSSRAGADIDTHLSSPLLFSAWEQWLTS